MQFTKVTALAEGNVYFDGKVISHTNLLPDDSRKTRGVILPGTYHIGTQAAELMEIVAGSCTVVLDGTDEDKTVAADSSFEVSANSGFTITVADAPCHYVCSFLS
jgi:uncharacterized protein YaiE (UPF0345 family)